jgi:hypothetical protein
MASAIARATVVALRAPAPAGPQRFLDLSIDEEADTGGVRLLVSPLATG